MSKRILVVDDEPNIVLSLEFLMTQAGYAVITAADGEAALQSIEATPPDLVLLDVNIPKRNGFEVCETIRANPAWRGVRVVMQMRKKLHAPFFFLLLTKADFRLEVYLWRMADGARNQLIKRK